MYFIFVRLYLYLVSESSLMLVHAISNTVIRWTDRLSGDNGGMGYRYRHLKYKFRKLRISLEIMMSFKAFICLF